MRDVATTDPDLPLTEQETYVWNRLDRDVETPAVEAHQMLAVAEALTSLLASNLPLLEPVDLDPETEEGVHAEFIEDLRDPFMTYGNCDTIARAVLEALEVEAMVAFPTLLAVERVEVVQGLVEPGAAAHCVFHDALLVRLVGGGVFVVDFAFSQFGVEAEWPLVAAPRAWEERLAAAVLVPSPGAVFVEQGRMAWGDSVEESVAV